MSSNHPDGSNAEVGDSIAGSARDGWAQARNLADIGRLKVRWHAGLDTAPPPLPPGTHLADKVEGMLLGLAVGDALGNTSESRNPESRQRDHGWIAGYLPNRYSGGRAVGVPSDDSQMAFWTLEQMLADPASLPRTPH